MNEKKQNLNFMAIEPKPTYIPQKIEVVTAGNKYVAYGKNNKYPQEIYEKYIKCSTLNSIINTTTDYILGNGIEEPEAFINSKGEDLEVIIRKLGIQYLIYGGYSFKVTRNSKLQMIDLLVVDFKTIRLNEDKTKVYVSKNKLGWGSYGSNQAEEYDVYNPKKNESIYVYTGVINDEEVYPTPRYNAVLPSVETEISIQTFHLNAIKKGFTGSFMLNFNNGTPSKEEMDDTEKKVIDKFCGEENAGQIMITFNDNKESQTTVARIPEDNMDKKYEILTKSVMNNIFGAFSCTPILVGRTNEGIGFNTQEFEESFKLYNRTVVQPYQKQILKSLKAVGIENITIKPFSLEDDTEQKVTNETNSEVTSTIDIKNN